MRIEAENKINVFISSSIDGEKYRYTRKILKESLEATGLFNVFVFEKNHGSSQQAWDYFLSHVRRSDVIIFLIDNKDGIKEGTRDEIREANKYEIKSLYYFCNENEKQPTDIQINLQGGGPVYKEVASFEDMYIESFKGIIEDILYTYQLYCDPIKRSSVAIDVGEKLQSQTVQVPNEKDGNVVKELNSHLKYIKKTTLQDIGRTKREFEKIFLGFNLRNIRNEEIRTGYLDSWGLKFLNVLFNGESIDRFDANQFVNELKKDQDEIQNNLVAIRWNAIKRYFMDDIDGCIDCLNQAYELALSKNMDDWIIDDILIDIRNQEVLRDTLNLRYKESDAQKQLNSREVSIYYPVLDRINSSLTEGYIEGLYKEKMQSPFTVTIGGNYSEFINSLADTLIVSMYNGSLTHILRIFNKAKLYCFYMSEKYTEWKFRKDLLKYAIYLGDSSDTDKIISSYADILIKINSDEAREIINFCKTNPITYKRNQSVLIAFGKLNDYLSDKDFKETFDFIEENYRRWIDNPSELSLYSKQLIDAFNGAIYRVDADKIICFCIDFLDKGYSAWYYDLFKKLLMRIDYSEASTEMKIKLVEKVKGSFSNQVFLEQAKRYPWFLLAIRNILEDTVSFDDSIRENLTEWYESSYIIEITDEKNKDFSSEIKKDLELIRNSNITQGKNGTYYASAMRYYATIRQLLLDDEYICANELLVEIVKTISETILESNEGVDVKIDAVSLLVCILCRYKETMDSYREIVDKMYRQRNDVRVHDKQFFSTNVSSIPLRIGMCLCGSIIGEEIETELLELVSMLMDDKASTITTARVFREYLEANKEYEVSEKLELIIIGNMLNWLRDESLDLRWNATKILIAVSSNPHNQNMVNRMAINLMSNDDIYIKNLILRDLGNIHGITETNKKIIKSLGQNDVSYIVRKRCNNAFLK